MKNFLLLTNRIILFLLIKSFSTVRSSEQYVISTYYKANCGTTGINFFPPRTSSVSLFTSNYGPSAAYLSDNLDYVVRKAVNNNVTIFAGTFNDSSSSSLDLNGDGGLAISATFNSAWTITFDTVGNMYISDSFNNRIRKVDVLTNIITTFAGTGNSNRALGPPSIDSGDATSANLFRPVNLFVDITGEYLYFADRRNHRIRRIDFASEQISTVVGASQAPNDGRYSGDGGPATSAYLQQPYGVIQDSTGNLYIADTNNNLIRKVDTSGIITTVAGVLFTDSSGALTTTSTSGQTNAGYNGDNIAATSAKLNAPRAVWVDTDGNIFIADTNNNLVRKVDTNGNITTIAGIPGSSGYNGDDINGVDATLNFPVNLIGDGTGDIYITDFSNFRVRRLTLIDQVVITPTPTIAPICSKFPTSTVIDPTTTPTCSPAPTAVSTTQWPTKTKKPSQFPTAMPSNPTASPSFKPTRVPSFRPTGPSAKPSLRPTKQPIKANPTNSPTMVTSTPSYEPTPSYVNVPSPPTNEPTPTYV
eukprot:gene7175-9784_t